jgi:hypothetical protein
MTDCGLRMTDCGLRMTVGITQLVPQVYLLKGFAANRTKKAHLPQVFVLQSDTEPTA